MLGDSSIRSWSQISDRHLAELDLSKVTTLALQTTRASLHGLQALSRRELPALRHLSVYMKGMGPEVGATLATAAWREQLVSLNVCGNRLGPLGLSALVSEDWPSLAIFACGYDDLGDAGAVQLADAALPTLADLNVRMNGITAAGARALVEAYGGQLVRLGLEDNPLGSAGIAMLAAAKLPRLARLDVRDTHAGNARLDDAPWADQVKELHQGAFQAPPVPDDAPRWRFQLAVRAVDELDYTEVDLCGPQIVIGRSPRCELSFRKINLARYHATIRGEADRVVAFDNKSSNGTQLNGRLLDESVLHEGDELIAGGVIIRVLKLRRIDPNGQVPSVRGPLSTSEASGD